MNKDIITRKLGKRSNEEKLIPVIKIFQGVTIIKTMYYY